MSAKDSYCRFCAELKPLYETTDLTTDLRTRLEIKEKLSLLQINFVDLTDQLLPKTICACCLDTLNISHEFYTKVKISQVVLCTMMTSEYKSELCDAETLDFDDVNDVKLENSGEQNEDKHTINPQYDDAKYEEASTKVDTSWPNYPWVCGQCKLHLDSLQSLRMHCREYHGVCGEFHCADCGENSDDYSSFVNHVKAHRVIHYCEFCNIKLENPEHIKTHASQPICTKCGEIFPNDTTLLKHLSQYQTSKTKLTKKKLSSELKELLSYGVEIFEINEEIQSWKDYSWVCQCCSMKVPNQESLRNHTKEVHNKCFAMKCVDCMSNMDNFGEFVDHVRMHRVSLKSFCQYCDSRNDDDNQNIIHINKHLTDYQCDACGEIFQNKTDMHKHVSIYNPPKSKRVPFKRRDSPITMEDLTCNICKKLTKSLTSLRAHKKLHTDRNRDYTCDRCGKAFFTKGALSAHNIIHENPEPQICKICKKSFLTLTRLKKHVKTHYASKPFQCNECHRFFRLKEHLKGHMITHTDLMPYSCQYCNKAFRHRNVLKIHENQHTGARPYCCETCNMEFANWSNCNKHLKRKHGTTLAKNMMTPQGKLPINPKTGKPKKLKDLEMVKEWTEQIMVPCKRGKKTCSDTTIVNE